MEGRKCYLLNDNAGTGPSAGFLPFGYPGIADPATPFGGSAGPCLIRGLAASTANTFALTDVDKINVPNPTISCGATLPHQTVDGQVRKQRIVFRLACRAKPVGW